MNFSGFIDEDIELFDVNETAEQTDEFATVYTFYEVFVYVCMALGIPGNILSAIVWLRLHVASKNSSAVYLAALAINDIAFLLFITYTSRCDDWLCHGSEFLFLSTTTLEPLLVLGFSVERLIAICCPLQVLCICLLYGR